MPPVGRRLELELVRNMLAILFICHNVMQLMLLLYLLMYLCFGISFSNSTCRERGAAGSTAIVESGTSRLVARVEACSASGRF